MHLITSSTTRNPALYQLNTRASLTTLSRALGRRATLDDIPDQRLDELAHLGFEWVWLLSVWDCGRIAEQVARSSADLRRGVEATLPGLAESDIGASGFAIAGYTVPAALGGDAALARLRARLATRNLRLMLDFVPNHTAIDHPWATLNPEYYVQGSEADLDREPGNYVKPDRARPTVFAHGRDPHFPGWTDTLQLDYSDEGARRAMIEELVGIAARCDGVRCDMAMLLLPEVFGRTWGRRALPFWESAIAAARVREPRFCFLAEVYWGLEAQLLRAGFDYAYDKELYDVLRGGSGRHVREQLAATDGSRGRFARFLENHDEARAAVVFGRGQHEAAAVVTFFAPGLRFFHDGQLDGRRVRIPPQVTRSPDEPVDAHLSAFYRQLLEILQSPLFHEGQWRLAKCTAAWSGNPTADDFIAQQWTGAGEGCLVAVNYASHASQCFVEVAPLFQGASGEIAFRDLASPAVYVRDTTDLLARGLYLDLPAWGHHVFAIDALSP